MSDYSATLLTLGPAGVPAADERNEALVSELRNVVWGRHGEKAGAAWVVHECYLRQFAKARGFPAMWAGKFFGEAKAIGQAAGEP